MRKCPRHSGYASFIWLIAVCSLPAQIPPPGLKALEERADTEFTGHDCAAAEKTYHEALDAAQAAGEINRTAFYYTRIGNCRTRVGDLAAALDAYQRVMAIAEAAGDRETLAIGIHGAALQLQKLGRLDEAVTLGQREYELAQQCGHPKHLVRAMWLVAEQYGAVGKVRDGLSMMNRALVISRTTTDTVATGVLLDNLADTYVALGDLETALRLEKEILAMRESDLESMASTYSPASTYNNMGEIQRRAGHTADARKSFQKAIDGSFAPDAFRLHAVALFNLADMQNDAGQFVESDENFRQALEIADTVKLPDLLCAIHQIRSDALLTRRDVKGALDDGAESLRIARQTASPDRVYKALLSLGAANAAAGDQGAARDHFDEALRIVETLRAQSSAEVSDLRSSFAGLIPLYQASVRNLIDLYLPGDALQRAEQAKARVLMDILLRGGMDERSAMTSSEVAQQGSLRKRLAIANAAVAGNPSSAATRALQDAMVDYRQFRRNIYDNHPELAVQSADFEPARPDKLAPLLRGGKTALLDYFVIPSGVALFVVRESGISTYLLPDPKHTLAAEARRFRDQLANRELGYKAGAQRLFNRVLAPAMADLRGITDWIVSPDGVLWEIPFEALIDPAGRHVIETRAVTLVPSLTAALELHERSGLKAGKPLGSNGIRLLAFGNPLPSSAPLPDAAREVAEIAANYPRGSALVLTGASATAAAFRERAPAASIIHLAAHAGLNNGDPLSSFVSLGSGGKGLGGEEGTVTALEIMSLRLQADLVVLSACETAAGTSSPGEGMMGMGWAFSAAGASSSLLSFWKVDSAASREFMTAFYRHFAAAGVRQSRAAALRQASLDMLQSSAYRHPFYWAAFTLWGDGSSPHPTAPALLTR